MTPRALHWDTDLNLSAKKTQKEEKLAYITELRKSRGNSPIYLFLMNAIPAFF
jgi:hypothetical protein